MQHLNKPRSVLTSMRTHSSLFLENPLPTSQTHRQSIPAHLTTLTTTSPFLSPRYSGLAICLKQAAALSVPLLRWRSVVQTTTAARARQMLSVRHRNLAQECSKHSLVLTVVWCILKEQFWLFMFGCSLFARF